MHQMTLLAITKDGRVGYKLLWRESEQCRSSDKMRTHDIEISEPIQPLASEQRQRKAFAAATTTNKRAATRTKRELSDAREGEMEGRRQERGIEKEHETVTTSIPRNAFNSTFSSPFVDGNMFKEADIHIMNYYFNTNSNVSGNSKEIIS